jgi:hypothetical protein
MCCDKGKKRTVTRWVTLVQQKLLTFITAHEFTQPCSILSLNSDTMCAPTRLSELMCCDKGKKFLLH